MLSWTAFAMIKLCMKMAIAVILDNIFLKLLIFRPKKRYRTNKTAKIPQTDWIFETGITSLS